MKTYHVFSNNLDEWIVDKKEAEELFLKWCKEYGCCRLYEMDTEDEETEGDCIASFGEYPL